jgi:hypothetical protein
VIERVTTTAASRARAWPIALLFVLQLSAAPAAGEEPWGFLDRPWGTPWHPDAIRSLPGCEGQGEVVADVEGQIARVVQPECVGYRLPDGQRVTLMLFYPEIKRHRLEDCKVVVRTLLALPRVWGLTAATVDRLRTALAEIERLDRLRKRFGDGPPVFSDLGHLLVRPDGLDGLQGYQLNFRPDVYATLRSAALAQLGPPMLTATGWVSSEDGFLVAGEVLEWSGERTLAVLREHGPRGPGGHFTVVTRAYRDAVTAARVAGRRPENPMSYPWFLELIEGFAWARDR